MSKSPVLNSDYIEANSRSRLKKLRLNLYVCVKFEKTSVLFTPLFKPVKRDYTILLNRTCQNCDISVKTGYGIRLIVAFKQGWKIISLSTRPAGRVTQKSHSSCMTINWSCKKGKQSKQFGISTCILIKIKHDEYVSFLQFSLIHRTSADAGSL